MAFKMKGFPLRSGFKHTGGRHEDHHGSGYGVINKKSDDTGDDEKNKNILSEDEYNKTFTPVVEDDNYKNAKLAKARRAYNYLKSQIERGVYGDNPPKLPPRPTMNNLDDFDMNDGHYKY